MDRVYSASSGSSSSVCADSDSHRWLPSFFIIGPPRTGTTWLYEVLKDHTLLPAFTKETRFFDTHFQRGMDWYRAHFPQPSNGRRSGEIAPTYFASADASERIARTVPDAKVVCIFRDPVQRLISLYKLKRAYALIPWTFEQAMERDPEMLESSKYASRFKAWQHALGTDHVQATFYDDLRDRSQAYLNALVDFIGIPRFSLTESQLLRVHASETMTHPRSYQTTRSASTMADWFKARRLDRFVAAVRNSPLRRLVLGGGSRFADLPGDLVLKLYEACRPEVEELEAILNCDLSAWKSPRLERKGSG